MCGELIKNTIIKIFARVRRSVLYTLREEPYRGAVSINTKVKSEETEITDARNHRHFVVAVSNIQRIGCQPEQNYFTRWPIPLVVC